MHYLAVTAYGVLAGILGGVVAAVAGWFITPTALLVGFCVGVFMLRYRHRIVTEGDQNMR